jgi:hypothetical protein
VIGGELLLLWRREQRPKKIDAALSDFKQAAQLRIGTHRPLEGI